MSSLEADKSDTKGSKFDDKTIKKIVCVVSCDESLIDFEVRYN